MFGVSDVLSARSRCHLKMGRWKSALADAECVLSREKGKLMNTKFPLKKILKLDKIYWSNGSEGIVFVK